jgi:endonuclease/exonuclease/phosphatase family metal-dependent hydrolase
VTISVVTWNIKGRAQPDLERVAVQLDDFGADVVALQEVLRRQASGLARRLGWATAHWSFKHLPFPSPPEGHAVLSPHSLVDAETVTVSEGAPFWSYRRRIAQLCAFGVGGRTLHMANTHLASDDRGARAAQAERLLTHVQSDSWVVGDLNASPGGAVLQLFRAAGLRDAWAELHPGAQRGEGATNWRRSDPDDRPTNRIDYVLVPAGCRVVAAAVPSATDSDLSAYRRLSDHLPVRVEVEVSADPS